MNSVSMSADAVNEAIGAALRQWPTKVIARRLKASIRTVENWKLARTGPQVKHLAAMMLDDVLCPALLKAFGRDDLAIAAELQSLNQRIDALKAAEARHEREANEIRRTLEMGSQRVGMDGRPAPRPGDGAKEARGVVPRQDD